MDMDKLVSLCKRRGIIFPSSEIYGGLNGFWDYGPLGVELKRNIKEAWWRDNVLAHDDTATAEGTPSSFSMVGLDCSIIMNPKIWEASGHVGGFSDPMVDCRETKERYRADQLYVFAYELKDAPEGRPTSLAVALTGGTVDDARASLADRLANLARKGHLPVKLKELGEPEVTPFLSVSVADRDRVTGPSASKPGTLTEPRNFNLMFESHAGAIADEANKVYLRPETAQGIFANFKNVVDTGRVKIPFGIAQIGKSFRNEINPRNFIFRSREFEQMEIEFFCRPEEATEWYAHWRKTRFQWYVDHGIKSDKLRLRDHDPDELAFYSTATADIEYEFPFGISELEGIAHRGAYDLGQHQKFSGKDLTYFDEEKKERYLPHVIEPSAGRRPGHARVPLRGLPGGRGRGRDPDRPEVPPPLRPDQGGRVPAGQARRDARDGREDLPRPQEATSTSSSTRRGRSAAATAARTRPARRSASPSTARRSPTGRSPSATATVAASGESPRPTSVGRAPGSPRRPG